MLTIIKRDLFKKKPLITMSMDNTEQEAFKYDNIQKFVDTEFIKKE